MTQTLWIAAAAMVLGGIAISVQAPINARLASGLGNGITAAAVSFGVGFAFLALIAVVQGLPPLSAVKTVPWWAWTGGLLGTTYVVAALFAVTRIGAVSMIAALILGQLLAAMALDTTGAFGLEQKALTPTRLAAVAMVAGGLILSRF